MKNPKSAESSPSLEISRCFDASPERVFDAWVSLEWGEWLPPAGAVCKVRSLDARVGGRYLIDMTMPDGRTVEISGMYREVIRPSKLVFTWLASYSGQETLITVSVREEGSGSLMTLMQEGFPSAEMRDGYNGGWTGPNGSFDKLAASIARRSGARVA